MTPCDGGCLAPSESRPRTVRQQFGNPTGLLGWLVGHVMAAKNGERSRFVLSLLALAEAEAVLEVGFGPGADLRRAARIAPRARLAGVDRSAEMLRQARRRNAAAVESGRMDLRLGTAEALPFPDGAFDRAFSINSVQFWADRGRALREILRVLRPGALAAVAIRPREKGATAASASRWREELESDLRAAGFADVSGLTLALARIPVACVLGRRPAAAPRER